MRSHWKRRLWAAALVGSTGTVRAAELTVSAAASLTDAFPEIGRAFEAGHPGTEVRFNFAASEALVQQLEAGAPVDVLATADERSMDQARALIDPATRADFARNTLVAIVPHDSRFVPRGLPDLARTEVERVALGNPESVPAGRYARDALERAGIWAVIATKAVYTQNVRQGLVYVARGEVDVGLVYATDAAVRKVRIAFTVPTETSITYPIAVVAGGGGAAGDFVGYVLSPPGQAILHRYGFLPP
jgi:molybdate transport system substrate-binding protein